VQRPLPRELSVLSEEEVSTGQLVKTLKDDGYVLVEDDLIYLAREAGVECEGNMVPAWVRVADDEFRNRHQLGARKFRATRNCIFNNAFQQSFFIAWLKELSTDEDAQIAMVSELLMTDDFFGALVFKSACLLWLEKHGTP
jgi:hypothetical protein